MTDIKDKALSKMLVEMANEHTSTEDKIHNWLCDQNDDELFAGVFDTKKSIGQAVEFCGSKARELAMRGVAMVDVDTVYGWVRYYFVTPDIKFDKPNLSNVATNTATEKTKPKPKPKAKKKASKIEMPKGEQLDLLSFL